MAKMYFKTGITGGDDSTSGDLDGIDGAVLADGDSAIVVDSANALAYFYALDADSGEAESLPEVVEPDINAENKRWLLQKINSDTIGTGKTIGDIPQYEDDGSGNPILDHPDIIKADDFVVADIYGLRWNRSTDTFTRLYKASGLTAGANFDSILPWSGMRRCNVADDGTINAYYGDAGFAYDGSNGQVMVEVPKFWYKTYREDKDNIVFLVANEPKSGFKLHPAFVRNGQVLDYIYPAAFEGHSDGGSPEKMESIANVVPSTSTSTHDTIGSITPYSDATIVGCRTAAQERGIHWEQCDFLTRCAIYYLFIVEYATFDMQSAIAEGVVDRGSGTDHNGVITGETAGYDGGDDLGNSSGTSNTGNGNGYESISYRGIENLWGNIWEWCDGINIQADHKPWIADHGFASDKFSSPYYSLNTTLPNSNDYGSDILINDVLDAGFLTIEVNGSSSSGLFDYYYQDTGDRVARVGGNWSVGLYAGGFTWLVNPTSATSNRTIGSRALLMPDPYNRS